MCGSDACMHGKEGRSPSYQRIHQICYREDLGYLERIWDIPWYEGALPMQQYQEGFLDELQLWRKVGQQIAFDADHDVVRALAGSLRWKLGGAPEGERSIELS